MVAELMPIRIQSAGLTDVGLVRERNEDVWAQLEKERVYVLADGMGGHRAGDVAAREAVRTFCEILKEKLTTKYRKRSLKEFRRLVELALVRVNSHVHRLGQSLLELRGMGTTLCCLCVHEKGVVFGHIGDSRIYRLREGKLEQLTRDHSLLRELIDLGQLGKWQAEEFLYKNIITQAVGTESTVEPSVGAATLKPGEKYLMCTDGLSDLLTRKELEAEMLIDRTPEEQVESLVALGKEKGGHDNITVVVVQMEREHAEDLS